MTGAATVPRIKGEHMKKRIIIIAIVVIGLAALGLGTHLAFNGFDLQTALRNMHGGS
jgi:hypothetical protein